MQYLPDMDYFPGVAIYGDAGSLSPSESPVISVTAAGETMISTLAARRTGPASIPFSQRLPSQPLRLVLSFRRETSPAHYFDHSQGRSQQDSSQ